MVTVVIMVETAETGIWIVAVDVLIGEVDVDPARDTAKVDDSGLLC